MAVVFISPKKKQRMFLVGIVAGFVCFVTLVTVYAWASAPTPSSGGLVFNKKKVNIDFKMLDTDQFRYLEHFQQMPMQFKSEATTEGGKGKKVTGYISAISLDEAKKVLAASNLAVGKITEVMGGRDNPFVPYQELSGITEINTANNVNKTKTTK